MRFLKSNGFTGWLSLLVYLPQAVVNLTRARGVHAPPRRFDLVLSSSMREPVQRGVAIDLPGKKMRYREVGPVGCVGPSLRLKADGVGLPIKPTTLSGGAAIEIVPRIDLQTGLIGVQFEHAARA